MSYLHYNPNPNPGHTRNTTPLMYDRLSKSINEYYLE